MPIYEYECGKCRYRFEIRQGFNDEPQAQCPQCQGGARRIFHPAPIIFKGSGFYVTDHRQDSKGSNKGTETGKGVSEASKGE